MLMRRGEQGRAKAGQLRGASLPVNKCIDGDWGTTEVGAGIDCAKKACKVDGRACELRPCAGPGSTAARPLSVLLFALSVRNRYP